MPPLPIELVEPGKEFWLRYPAKYTMKGGFKTIWASFDVSEMHEQMINENYFNYVCWSSRHTPYKNSRGVDPQVKLFLDKEKIKISDAWKLPIPNAEAAYKSLAKYGKDEVNLNVDQLKRMNKAWMWTEMHFLPYMGNSRVVSLEEAVQRLDMSSSSGFPFNKLYSTKKDLFERDSEIMQWLEEDWENLADDPMWTTVFSSSLKEELRPKEKIVENSQRTFTAGATDATVQGNRLFVDQNEKMYASHLKTSSAIGMSPLLGNWEKLYRKLNVFPHGYALDESQYDSSIRKFMIWGCAQLRWKMLRTEDKTERNLCRIRTYYRNLINTLVLTPEGIMVMKKLGMPSGCVSTVTDNTLILYTYLAYAWISVAPDEFNTYAEFENHTAKALVGDDNTWTVSSEAHGFFNATSVIEVWKTVGITTTTDSMISRPASELDFLSAHTVFIKGIAVPLYSRDKLMSALLHAPQKKIQPATSLQRCTNLLQIGWTDLVFRNFCRDFIAWLLMEYDEVLREDERWIIAKSGIMSDERYFHLFTKRQLTFQPQSYRETQERLIKLDNESYIMSTTTQTIVKSRRARGRGARGPRKGKTIVKTVTVKPKKSLNRRRRNNRRARKGIQGQGRADTSSKFSGSNTQRNVRTMSKPEPFEGDELIGTLAGSVGFATTAYSLNPGNPTTFPWLNKIASLYERYKFTMFEIYFKHAVSQYNAQGQAGLALLSALYDAASSPPASKQQIEATDPYVVIMANENAICRLAPKGMHPNGEPKFVRGVQLPGGTDIKTYDAATLYVSTQDFASTANLGEIHVRYKGFFYNRILDSSLVMPPANYSTTFLTATAAAPASGVTAVLGAGGAWTSVSNGLGATIQSSGVISLPPGNYAVDVTNTVSAATYITTNVLQSVKNASVIVTASQAQSAAAAVIQQQDSSSFFVSLSSTDTLTFNMNYAYTGASAPYVATLRIRAA